MPSALADLPDAMLVHVFAFLPHRDVLGATVSKAWSAVCRCDHVWKPRFLSEFACFPSSAGDDKAFVRRFGRWFRISRNWQASSASPAHEGAGKASAGASRCRDLQSTVASDSVSAVHFDGGVVASGSVDGSVRVWRGGSFPASPQTLLGHSRMVSAVQVHAGSDRVYSASYDNTVLAFAVSSGRCVAELRSHRKEVRALHVSRDGRLLLSGGEDAAVLLWNADTATASAAGAAATSLSALQPQPLRSFDARFPVYCVAHAEGKRGHGLGSVLAGTSRGQLLCWDAESGKLECSLDYCKHLLTALCVESGATAEGDAEAEAEHDDAGDAGSDSWRVAVGSGHGRVSVFDRRCLRQGDAPIHELGRVHSLRVCHLLLQTHRLTTASWDGGIKVFDLRRLRPDQPLSESKTTRLTSVPVGLDSTTLGPPGEEIDFMELAFSAAVAACDDTLLAATDEDVAEAKESASEAKQPAVAVSAATEETKSAGTGAATEQIVRLRGVRWDPRERAAGGESAGDGASESSSAAADGDGQRPAQPLCSQRPPFPAYSVCFSADRLVVGGEFGSVCVRSFDV